jgi:NAD(P)-dependent dehydrogenase (short-subunit alcohol dehydrogenase family)
MPLAKIHVLEGRYDERRLGDVSKAVQDALMSILRIPADDFFQIIHVLPRNHASKGLSANSVYSATQAAVRSFARTWTTDLKGRRIRVNAVSPGATDTPGLNNLLASAEAGQQRWKMLSESVPLGRLGTPDEIAKAVVFLASDDSSYITGTELFVDGGFAQV